MTSGGSTPGPSSVDERAAADALLLLLLRRSTPTTIITSSSSSSFSITPTAPSGFAVSVSERGSHRGLGGVSALEEEAPSPSCSSASCSSSCISEPSRLFAPVAEVRSDPLLLLASAVCRVELKRKAVKRARSIVLYGSIGSKDMKDKGEEQQLPQGKQHSKEDPVASSLSSISTVAPPGDSTPFPASRISDPSPPILSPEVAPLRSGHFGEHSIQPSPPSSAVSGESIGTSSSRRGGSRVVMPTRRAEGKYSVSGNSKGGGALVYGSSGVKRQAEAILEFLSDRGCTSEVRIRAAIGDSPDTSKALRLLLKRDQVKRSGTGGRPDPFLYRVSRLEVEGSRTPGTSAQDGTGAQMPAT